MKIAPDNIDLFIFDFDGVLTDNSVYISQDGVESVKCSRSDGLAFDVLRALKKKLYIISTEMNPVVKSRADKLKVMVLYGVKDKAHILKTLLEEECIDPKRVLYVGNDLNDYHAMRVCGYKVTPSDAHHKISEIADIVLNSKGGDGVVRELVENVLHVDILKILY